MRTLNDNLKEVMNQKIMMETMAKMIIRITHLQQYQRTRIIMVLAEVRQMIISR